MNEEIDDKILEAIKFVPHKGFNLNYDVKHTEETFETFKRTTKKVIHINLVLVEK